MIILNILLNSQGIPESNKHVCRINARKNVKEIHMLTHV